MAASYSRRFLICTSQAKFYTVPAGRRAIVKCLTAYSGGPGNGTFALAIDGVPVLLGISYYSTPSVVSDLMIVVNAGEVLSLNAPSPSSAQVSGYLLNDA